MSKRENLTRRAFVANASLLAASAAVGVGQGEEAKAQSAGGEGDGSGAPRARNAALTRELSVDTPPSSEWPVLARYDVPQLTRIAMPIGGIGTGTISLGGRGDLRDWELVNKPAKGYTPINTHFALYAKAQSGKAVARALEGPVDPIDFQGASGSPIRNHGLPRFRKCNFAAAYPLGQVLLEDPDVPLRVRIEAFNPMTPVDTDLSGIPVAILRFVLINSTGEPVEASVCGTIENFIGWDGDHGKVEHNVNEFRNNEAPGRGLPLRGLFMRSERLDPKSPAWGTLALATTEKDITYRTDWIEAGWGGELLDYWDDFSSDGKLENRKSNRPAPFASLAASTNVPANGSASLTFLIGWHFPNRLSWTDPERIGNFYCTQYADAWDAIAKTAPQIEELEKKTVAFVRSFVDCDIPQPIKEAALCNASTLRTQTAFRTQDGRFYGWEGCNDHGGCCHGSCTHVWNYEQATPFLYGSLARSMQEVEFGHATRDNGYQSFRVNLPLIHAQEARPAAADGQMGSIMRLYREWKMSGDDAFLKPLWPHAKKALEFAWIPGGWDANRDGVMEGCQHNTMDIEYYGPNPEVGGWYLGALRASEEMARHMGDGQFADTCHKLFESGSKWLDANLFNGNYYEQHIIPPKSDQAIADGLRLGVGARNLAHPELQIGAGCLTDQLVGQYVAHICGLGYLLNKDHVAQTLKSILKYNWRDEFFSDFNPMRSYAMDNDQGVIICTYPKGRRPEQPFPYAFEVWTGLEYSAAVGMIYEGQLDEALKVINAARDRHDGRKRNPFDEPECGHHYARAMASWGAVVAYTGFRYDGVEKAITFRSSEKPARWFWSSGNAWGTVKQTPANGNTEVVIEVMGGGVNVNAISLAGVGIKKLPNEVLIEPGKPLNVKL
jgi:uncharacterized protein (DUF608 family)